MKAGRDLPRGAETPGIDTHWCTRVWPDHEGLTHDWYFECSLEAVLVHLIADYPVEDLQEGFEREVIDSLDREELLALYADHLEHPYAANKLARALLAHGSQPWLRKPKLPPNQATMPV